MSRSPPHNRPRDLLQNDERQLPFGWEKRISNNVDPSRVYYTNGRQSQWNFPNQEAEYQARIELEERQRAQAVELQRAQALELEKREELQRAQAVERRARHRIQRAQGVERRAQEVERRALMARVEVRRNRGIGLNLQEHLELLTSINHFNVYNRGIVLGTLRQFILNDNIEPIDSGTVRWYIEDLQHLIKFLEDPDVHSDLKFLCERIFEEMYKKLAEEKKLIDNGLIRENERETEKINFHLNVLNSLYIEFKDIIPS